MPSRCVPPTAPDQQPWLSRRTTPTLTRRTRTTGTASRSPSATSTCPPRALTRSSSATRSTRFAARRRRSPTRASSRRPSERELSDEDGAVSLKFAFAGCEAGLAQGGGQPQRRGWSGCALLGIPLGSASQPSRGRSSASLDEGPDGLTAPGTVSSAAAVHLRCREGLALCLPARSPVVLPRPYGSAGRDRC